MTYDNVNPEVMVVPTRRFATISAGTQALRRGLRLTVLAVWEALLVIWLCLCVCLVVVGVGLWLVPPALDAVRTQARRQRRLAWQLSELRVAENYLPDPAASAGLLGSWRREYARAGDPSTWKDLLWHLVNPFVGATLAFAPVALLLHGVFGLLLPLLWAPVVSRWDNSWYGFIPVYSFAATILACALGAVSVVLAFRVAPFFVRLHSRWVAAVLSTQSREELQARVDHLSRSRSHAVDHEANEIRRIERDLHDGAQARLVAMGMTLSAAERLMDHNPDAARAMVQEAKEASSAVLTELRDLVRGIHPPVLADRGLVDAVRSLALRSPLSVTVESDLVGRPTPPIESAVYFVVSELLTNAAKHAGATCVSTVMTHEQGTLRVTVEDNGGGGASLEKDGTGLQGIERRLAAFDGDLLVHSPQNGPTTMTVVIPCVVTP